MYRYSNGQISLADFKQPVDMNLKESKWGFPKSECRKAMGIGP